MDKSRVLIIHSIGYPYGIAEDFLHKEVLYLSKKFSKIILITRDVTSVDLRELPDNCQVMRIDLSKNVFAKLLSISNVLKGLFWTELFTLYLMKHKLNKDILKTILISLSNSKKIKRVSNKIILESGDTNLYFYSYWCDDAALALALLKKKTNVKTFCRIHRWDVYFEESPIGYLPFRKYISNHLDKIFSISKHGIEYAIDKWNVKDSRKFRLSRLGVENDLQFKTTENEEFLIVSCSNIIPVKRVFLIAQALEYINDLSIKWVHIGDGIQRSTIQEIEKKLKSNITVELKGILKNQDIYTFYKENQPDLFINVSSSEGVPVSIMEAMSFGIPVIATNVGGTSEIVNAQNGFLISAEISPNELAGKIIEFSKLSQDVKEKMQLNCYETWSSNYNAAKNYKDFLDAILSL